VSKRIARLALLGAAAASFALPATPASAHCNWTFPRECIETITASAVAPICHDIGTFTYCVPGVSA
jgi:hypothetical protein